MAKKSIGKAELQEWARGFSLLSDSTRLGVLKMLVKGPKNVTALCKGLGLKQPTVSHHLGLLRMGRMVLGTRKGKTVIYTSNRAALKMLGAACGKLMPRK